MNAKNLPLKFAFVALLVIVCVWSLKANRLREGIDLRGGHSLIFEIRTNQAEITRLTEQKKKLDEELAKAATPEEKKSINEQIGRVDGELSRYSSAGTESSDLAEKMISILKNRIDPQGLRSLEWRPLGNNRIEVRMPAGKVESIQAKKAYLDALDKLTSGNVTLGQLRRLVLTAPDKRQELLTQLAAGDETLQKRLVDLCQAYDTAENAKDEKARDEAFIAYRAKLDDIRRTNIDQEELQAIFSEFVSASEAAAINDNSRVEQRTASFKKRLDEFKTAHASRAEAIDKVAGLYEKWAEAREKLDDPADLKRLIAKAGVLEFRIAPFSPGSGQKEAAITSAEYQQYVESLNREGPDGLKRRNERFEWFPMHGEREGYDQLVTADYAGKRYILLYNQPGWEMLHETGAGWKLDRAYPTNDDRNQPAVGFMFDDLGAKRFSEMTGAHKQQHMAILLDDEVYSAPVIREAISKSGIISGRFTYEEVTDLVRTLEAGSLPARLNPNPVAESSFGAALGEENLYMALKAAYWSAVIISLFMLCYYMKAGIIANFALYLHILFVLGAMSLLNAVFTLPGIAGVILTIGMAVDANVLIYERLREEQLKAQSIRMAVKNAYHRAYTAIFDSNITSLLTCLILGWVGTEEIRGFAITLGLGVLFNLFASVTVTRWIFQAMLETHLVKGPLKMLHFIRTPKIDWMNKRYYFWAFSIITGILGIAAIVWQGSNIWGIEFSSGTQATVSFRADALLADPAHKGAMELPNDFIVDTLFRDQAKADGFDKLAATARVEKRIEPDAVKNLIASVTNAAKAKGVEGPADQITLAQWKAAGLNEAAFKKLAGPAGGEVLTADLLDKNLPARSYQVSTTETSVEHIRKVVRESFGSALVNRTASTFKMVGGEAPSGLGVEVPANGALRITQAIWQKADPAVRDDLRDNEGGVAFIAANVTPPLTRDDLMDRIREMRLQPDFAGKLMNRTEAVGITPVGEGKFSSFAILVMPSDPAAMDDPSAYEKFVKDEQDLLHQAFGREEAMTVTNFDAAIAGEAAGRAIMALIIGWVAITIYLWIRFGSVTWGLSAVITLIHDVIIATGLVAASNYLGTTAIGKALLIEPFKIDLAIVAALLTIIGYSVSDTIVVFDRIRENRGKLATVSEQVINLSINQTLSRTLLTSSTVFMVMLITYILGGQAIRGFCFAMLIGVLFGTYSSIAVSAPILLGFKGAVIRHYAEKHATEAEAEARAGREAGK